jgi:hypothetical protein
MNLDAIVSPVRMALGVVAVGLAVLLVTKMTGLVVVKYGFMELGIAGILCALVSR